VADKPRRVPFALVPVHVLRAVEGLLEKKYLPVEQAGGAELPAVLLPQVPL